jgi:HEAT repeat protein
MTMAQLSPDRASRIIERALDEKEPELRRAAALAAAATPKANEAVVQRMANILRDDREREGIRLQVAASLTAILTRERESPMRESVLEVFRGVIGDKYGTRMHRFRRFVESRLPPPSHLLAAICGGLGAIGDPDDQRLLMACLEDESPDVQEAARLAIGKLRAADRPSRP